MTCRWIGRLCDSGQPLLFHHRVFPPSVLFLTHSGVIVLFASCRRIFSIVQSIGPSICIVVDFLKEQNDQKNDQNYYLCKNHLDFVKIYIQMLNNWFFSSHLAWFEIDYLIVPVDNERVTNIPQSWLSPNPMLFEYIQNRIFYQHF